MESNHPFNPTGTFLVVREVLPTLLAEFAQRDYTFKLHFGISCAPVRGGIRDEQNRNSARYPFIGTRILEKEGLRCFGSLSERC